MGTTIEVQNIGRSIYTVRKNGNLVEKFSTETAALDLAREMSHLILRSDRQRMAIPTVTTTDSPNLTDVKTRLGGENTTVTTVARGSLTKISAPQEEALRNAIQYCGGKIRRGGKLHTGQVTSIALTLTQLYALQKRGYVTLIERNFEVLGGLVTDCARRALGLV